MIGQHGWYVFWKSVLGKEDESLIVFVGTVPPIARVPDYTRWAQYGGTAEKNTFRQVPTDLLVPLPPYTPSATHDTTHSSLASLVYSVGHLGSYETGGDHDGSHVGVDIRVPVGTPVQSIANGVVTKVSMQENGYGHHIVVKHPNVPNPDRPGSLTTLWSVYAHLDAILVSEGQIVHKGEQIGTSGQTGFASGPHLHFQIDTDDAPFHPYWPFTDGEMKDAGMSFTQAINRGLHQERGSLYTISPLLFAQSYTSYIATPTLPASVTLASLQEKSQASSVSSSSSSRRESFQERTLRLRAERLAARSLRASTRVAYTTLSSIAPSVPSVPAALPKSNVLVTEEKSPSSFPVITGVNTDVDHLLITHGGRIVPSWQKVRISALNTAGDVVQTPSFSGKIYLKAEFGSADIRPATLTSSDFVNGVATVNVLTKGTKTLFITANGALQAKSEPLVYER